MKKVRDAGPLGAVLRDFRLQRGFSQEALADKAGIHRTYIGAVERGERNLSFRTLSRIITALGVSWTELGEALDAQGQSY